MASGDPIEQGHMFQTSFYSSWKLLDAVAANTNGVWIDVRGFRQFTIEVSGIVSATVVLCVSNAAAKPDNTAHGAQLGALLTSDAMIHAELPVKWMKARVTGWTSGTITAIVQAVSP